MRKEGCGWEKERERGRKEKIGGRERKREGGRYRLGESNDEPWKRMTEGRMDRQTGKLELKG